MPKNFRSEEKNNKLIADVARKSALLAHTPKIIHVANESLLDYPNNIAIGDTKDLEESILQNGFVTPIEATKFGCEEGKYVIVSGHRRRAAGVKVGETIFPCIIRTFASAVDLENYVLFANNNRDSAKDPFLFCALYDKHEKYLDSINFKGSKREEIARRLNLSLQQAKRYGALRKVIDPIRVMVADELVSMSSAVPIAAHDEHEQHEIYSIMTECDVQLTRDVVKLIVDCYRDGMRSWSEIVKANAKTTAKQLMDEGAVGGDAADAVHYKESLADDGDTMRNPIQSEEQISSNFTTTAQEQQSDKADETQKGKSAKKPEPHQGIFQNMNLMEIAEKNIHSITAILASGAYASAKADEIEKFIGLIETHVQTMIKELSNMSEVFDKAERCLASFEKIKEAVNRQMEA